MEKKRRRGRPRKQAALRKRNNLTFRTRDGLREQLEKTAKENGRSISEEIEHRLQMSFHHDTAFVIARLSLENEELRAVNTRLSERIAMF